MGRRVLGRSRRRQCRRVPRMIQSAHVWSCVPSWCVSHHIGKIDAPMTLMTHVVDNDAAQLLPTSNPLATVKVITQILPDRPTVKPLEQIGRASCRERRVMIDEQGVVERRG